MMKKLSIILVLCLLLTGAYSVGATVNNTATTNANNLSYYFARQTPNVDQQLIKVIDSSKTTLDIAIYSLTKPTIVTSIVNAKNRGVVVEVITDKIEAATKSQKAELAILKADKIPVKINSHSGLMHLKMTVTENTVTTGSYNYSAEATTENDEVLVIIKDSSMVKTWKSEFDTMWNDTKNYKAY